MSLKLPTLIANALLLCAASLSNASPVVVSVALDLNPQKAHLQLNTLKKFDILGVNLKKHRVKLALSPVELLQLQAQHFNVKALSEHKPSSDAYLTPDQVVQALQTIQSQYPSLTNVFEIGKTHEQRSIMAMEISAQPGNLDKPALIFNAMHHAREVMTTEVVMHIAKVLTENYGTDLEITDWLDKYRIVLVPQVNPDGNALVSSGQTLWRKNAYSLNGELLGVDLNRNYPAYWDYCNGSEHDPHSETYKGLDPGSEPESQAMMGLVNNYRPVAEISYHSYSEMILYPYGCASIKNPATDLFYDLGQAMNAEIRNDNNQTHAYDVGNVAEVLVSKQQILKPFVIHLKKV